MLPPSELMPLPLMEAPLPVRIAMCASISRRAVSTLSGRPVTSKTGSLSRLGVTMYVCVWCWIRLIVAPLGPTTSPTTRYGTRTWMVIWPGMLAGGPGGVLVPEPRPARLFLRDARICEKCSAAERISRFALATSSLRPVTTNTGSSPRTGVLMYVFVFARSALILHPETKRKFRSRNTIIIHQLISTTSLSWRSWWSSKCIKRAYRCVFRTALQPVRGRSSRHSPCVRALTACEFSSGQPSHIGTLFFPRPNHAESKTNDEK